MKSACPCVGTYKGMTSCVVVCCTRVDFTTFCCVVLAMCVSVHVLAVCVSVHVLAVCVSVHACSVCCAGVWCVCVGVRIMVWCVCMLCV